jgi:putative transposase
VLEATLNGPSRQLPAPDSNTASHGPRSNDVSGQPSPIFSPERASRQGCRGLKPWIARRERLGRFVLRRDPRDISRIWALDPEGGVYLEVPYRTLSRPPISVWEQRAAIARLREAGRAQVDENALFAMVEQMRSITETAAATTWRARRYLERRSTTPVRTRPAPIPAPPDDTASTGAVAVTPFEVIEQW